jgi:hypothetical protein
MKAIVVYESHWGNTAAIARAIAEGIGAGAVALATDQATAAVLPDAELIVAGAPVIAFSLPTERMLEGIRKDGANAPAPPDLSHPLLRTWLAALPKGSGLFAAFETRVAWSPGGATGGIADGLERAGYRKAADPARFFVKGKFGPLKPGEAERAKQWGTLLSTRR